MPPSVKRLPQVKRAGDFVTVLFFEFIDGVVERHGARHGRAASVSSPERRRPKHATPHV
jgi:hypothetical protein